MPGPLARDRSTQPAAQNSPNKKTAARLARRASGFSASNDKYRAGYHTPGSENRKK